mmetsp:Transcript_106348/g.317849  ORF Transcript_106348/g.317849 Transcript_106348/m.317849 type:complete len:324 (+) Transcript_106348:44-1015(+)
MESSVTLECCSPRTERIYSLSSLGLCSVEHGSFDWSRLSTDFPCTELDADRQFSGSSWYEDHDLSRPTVSKEEIDAAVCNAVAKLKLSVTISDPCDQDGSLKMVSSGFEELTQYSRREIVGRTCRLLQQGCHVDPLDLLQMRISCSTGAHSTVLLVNHRKWGGFFRNLLYLGGLSVARDPSGNDCWYILGIQKELGDSEAADAQAYMPEVRKGVEDVRLEIGDALAELACRAEAADCRERPDAAGGHPRARYTLCAPQWRTARQLGTPKVAGAKLEVEGAGWRAGAARTGAEKAGVGIAWLLAVTVVLVAAGGGTICRARRST